MTGGVEVSGTDLDSPSVQENQDEFAGALNVVRAEKPDFTLTSYHFSRFYRIHCSYQSVP